MLLPRQAAQAVQAFLRLHAVGEMSKLHRWWNLMAMEVIILNDDDSDEVSDEVDDDGLE